MSPFSKYLDSFYSDLFRLLDTHSEQMFTHLKYFYIVCSAMGGRGAGGGGGLNDGYMTCDFTSLFNRISVISGRWTAGKERLCAMELRLRLRRFRLERNSNPGSLDQ